MMVTPMTSIQASPGIGAYYTPAQGAVTANPMYLPGANLGTPSMSLAPQPPSDVMVRSVATAPVGTTEGSIVVKDLFGNAGLSAQMDADGNISVAQSKLFGIGSGRRTLGRVDRDGNAIRKGLFGDKKIATLTENGTDTYNQLTHMCSQHGWKVADTQYNDWRQHFTFNGTFTARQENAIMYLLSVCQLEKASRSTELAEMFAAVN